MERPLFTIKPLSIQDENSAIHRKKATIDGKSKSSKPVAAKKGSGVPLETRRALNDITNKSSSIRIEAPSLKKGSQNNKKCNIVNGGANVSDADETSTKKKGSFLKEKLNIAEEGFLHDHSKCVEAQKVGSELSFWDTVLPGHGLHVKVKNDPVIESLELEELAMSEFSDWYKSPSSPIRWDSPPASPFTWELDPFELVLKDDHFDDSC